MRSIFFVFLVILFFPVIVSAQTCSEGSSRDCGITDVGECSYGTQTCSSGEWGICQGAIYPRAEVCFDSLDNDCDGSVDENCDCSSGSTRSCGFSSKGICRFGTETCVDNAWGSCQGAVYPEISELCNNALDDDCDGSIDENCVVTQGTCFDKLQNQGEQGIDCGGPCPSCGTCSDGVKNQNEINVDCGGVCPSCASCADRIQNQDEAGIDCGGSICPSCIVVEDVQEDAEARIVCQDDYCDIANSENESNCPQDCKPKTKTSFLPLVIIFSLLFLAIAIYFYRISRKDSGDKGRKSDQHGSQLPNKIMLKDSKIKSKKTRIEEELEKSMEKSSKLIRK